MCLQACTNLGIKIRFIYILGIILVVLSLVLFLSKIVCNYRYVLFQWRNKNKKKYKKTIVGKRESITVIFFLGILGFEAHCQFIHSSIGSVNLDNLKRMDAWKRKFNENITPKLCDATGPSSVELIKRQSLGIHSQLHTSSAMAGRQETYYERLRITFPSR